jgi:hypothetical protein
MHVPPTHVSEAPQRVPHPPQWLLSTTTSDSQSGDVSQSRYELVHCTPHVPLRQNAFAFAAVGHAFMQLPQFAGSKRMSTQLPLHAIVLPEQDATHMSVVVLQTRPPVHVEEPAAQRSAASSHDSTPLQATPSLQERDAPPPHVAIAVQVSLVVQNWPSSQTAPVFAVHAVVDVAGVQTSQMFDGFVDIAA